MKREKAEKFLRFASAVAWIIFGNGLWVGSLCDIPDYYPVYGQLKELSSSLVWAGIATMLGCLVFAICYRIYESSRDRYRRKNAKKKE